MNNSTFYAFTMLLAGLGIPVMATLNSGLGAKLQSPPLAATLLLLLGSGVAMAYLISTEGIPKSLYAAGMPWYFYTGGFFIAFYIFTITWVAPRFGIANAITFVLLGQLIAITVIDHFGLFGAAQFSLSGQRLTGLLLMATGVWLVLA